MTASRAARRGADYYFLPHFKAMPSYEKDVHGLPLPASCRALPYYLRTAFGLDDAAASSGRCSTSRTGFEPGRGADDRRLAEQHRASPREAGREAFASPSSSRRPATARAGSIGRQGAGGGARPPSAR